MMIDTHTVQDFLKLNTTHLTVDQLSEQHIVVCSNSQQSHWLSASIAKNQSQSPKPFLMPQVMSFSQWLEFSHTAMPDSTRHILSHNQQILLWHHALNTIQHDHNPSLLWQLAKQYHHHYQHEIQFSHDQHSIDDPLFSRTKLAYQQLCTQHHCIDHSTLEDSFSQWHQPVNQNPTTFIGFNVLTSNLKKILTDLGNSSLFFLSTMVDNPSIDVTVCHNQHDQIDYLLDHISQSLTDENQGTLGIIIPQHSDYAKIIDPLRSSLDLLSPSINATSNRISSFIPQPLASFALCQSLHSLLLFFKQPTFSLLQQIFSFPCFQNPDFIASTYHTVLQRLAHVPLSQWTTTTIKNTPSQPHLAACHQQLCDFISIDVDHTLPFHAWSHWFQSLLLDHFKYISPKSSTQQALYALWIKTVYQASPLEFIADHLFDYHSWLDCVFVHLDNTYYNDTSISNIVVMSWSHALEMPFDSLIFLSCHSGNWPPSINDDAMDSTQQSCYASIHTTLTHSAKKIQFLSPRFDDQAQPLLPSFFLLDLITDTVMDFNKHLPYYTCRNQAILKTDQNFGPEISESERSISTSVIQAYSRCHAQGFLQHRLYIQTQKPDSYGIGPADVGVLIHELLASFDDIKTDQFPSETAIDNKINLLLSSESKYRYLSPLQKNTLSIHLRHLLQDWINYRIDAHKNDNIIESHHELALEKTLFGLTFRIRLDRIDKYPDNTYRIIDYKTGLTQRSHWLNTPPQNPQLIIYALCLGHSSSIAYASLHPENYGYSGYGHFESDLPGIKPISKIKLNDSIEQTTLYNSWPQQISIWQAALSELIDAYKKGSIIKNPHNAKTTCTLCQLQNVCRIHEKKTGIQNNLISFFNTDNPVEQTITSYDSPVNSDCLTTNNLSESNHV